MASKTYRPCLAKYYHPENELVPAPGISYQARGCSEFKGRYLAISLVVSVTPVGAAPRLLLRSPRNAFTKEDLPLPEMPAMAM